MYAFTIDRVTLDNKTVYNAFTDRSITAGVLHCSHEISLTVSFDGTKCHLISGWEIAAEDIEYEPEDEEYLDTRYPNILTELASQIKSSF